MALADVLKSEAFANSPRLQDFLTYIVEEQIAGRGHAIKGKTIATDVYQRDLDEAGNAQNLVRVEARRLRRLLDEYYADEGRAVPLRIQIETGGYRPRFKTVEPAYTMRSAAVLPPEPRRKVGSLTTFAIFVSLGLTCLAVGFGIATFRNDARKPEPVTRTETARLAALRERSMSSVQAANLAQQARGLFFPLFDLQRQTITLESFRHVVALDPGLPAGYAGSAQVLALQSFLSDDATEASELLSEALAMAERATDLGPSDAWSQAAHGWTLAVAGDMAGALRRARIAVELAPEDGHTLDLVGITALLANDPSLMADVSDPDRPRTGSGRFAANNIWGTSHLMMGNYPEVVKAFSNAAERGLPVSAPSLMLLATAQRMSGDDMAAEQAILEMTTTWPGFPADEVSNRFFAKDPVTLKRVMDTLSAYSWNE
ncbi:hypothetical protein ACFORG_17175 [Lutimaribacter marinistellae]|uniref:Tetratricopeptide repeat-containing protein n=1 Tax=Lutimaribacter marinistellae TaxID=1820329 RepID=A0ABV7TKG1_9RHOB